MPLSPSIFARRTNDGEFVIHFDKEGHEVRREPYRGWLGPEMKPGEAVECVCDKGSVNLDCPIHAIPPGESD